MPTKNSKKKTNHMSKIWTRSKRQQSGKKVVTKTIKTRCSKKMNKQMTTKASIPVEGLSTFITKSKIQPSMMLMCKIKLKFRVKTWITKMRRQMMNPSVIKMLKTKKKWWHNRQKSKFRIKITGLPRNRLHREWSSLAWMSHSISTRFE